MQRLAYWVNMNSLHRQVQMRRAVTKEIEESQTQTLASEQYGIEIQHIGFSRLSSERKYRVAFQQMRAEQAVCR